MMKTYEVVIGLETHIQLNTETKIFCACKADSWGAEPNTNICPVCSGLPGVLPVLNAEAVEKGALLAAVMHAEINPRSFFDRKNYFYPDLPKGYQISQFELPICERGRIEIEVEGQPAKTIGITRIHMEEDAGKLVHDEREPVSYVDLNRTGTPLLEIVSEPDLRSPAEAAAYLKKLHAIVRYLDICDGNMQEGSFRCDANISLRPRGEDKLGTRTELKNMNSFRNVQLALEYEERRQRDLLLDGGEVVQQTLLWDPDRGCTEPMRGKEEAHDYRYFPDPDLVPVVIDEAWIERVQAGLPELPDARRQRFAAAFDLAGDTAELLTGSRELADYFEAALGTYANARKLANFIGTELLRDYGPERINECPVRPDQLAGLLQMTEDGRISGKIAKTVFAEMLATGHDPAQIVKERGLVQMSDEGELAALVAEIVAANPAQAQQFREGKTKVLGFFVGQLMQRTKGQANPQLANQLFTRELTGQG